MHLGALGTVLDGDVNDYNHPYKYIVYIGELIFYRRLRNLIRMTQLVNLALNILL